MRLGLVAAIIVGTVIASLPIVVNNVSNLELSNSVTAAPPPTTGVDSELSPSTQATASLSANEVSESPKVVSSGCVTSSSGPDKLVVCPAEVYVSEVGTEVKVGKNYPVWMFMTENPITVEPGTPIIDALKLMRDANIRHLPVVDKEGKPVGMLSFRDLVEAIVTLLSVPME